MTINEYNTKGDMGIDRRLSKGKSRKVRSEKLREKIADWFSRKRYTTLEKARGTVGEYSDYDDADQILAFIKEAGYVKPPESMEITELAEILYNFMKAGIQDYNSIKHNIQNFLLANHYVKLADDQSLPKTITNKQMAEAYGGYDFATEDMRAVCVKEQRNMLKAGWRKVGGENG